MPAGFDIMLGNGSDELISLLTMACDVPGASLLAPVPGFVMYAICAQLQGVKFHGVPLQADFELDEQAMLAAIAEHRPSLVYLAYPNNPTGTLWNAQVIERELALQVAAIKAIAEIWKTDQQIIVGGKDINNRDQFLQNNALPGNWAANRKAILITDNSTKLVDSATDASEGLKETFEKLVANKASIEDIPLIVTDLIKVLALIELVKKGSSA
jgi:hypothetical protein